MIESLLSPTGARSPAGSSGPPGGSASARSRCYSEADADLPFVAEADEAV